MNAKMKQKERKFYSKNLEKKKEEVKKIMIIKNLTIMIENPDPILEIDVLKKTKNIAMISMISMIKINGKINMIKMRHKIPDMRPKWIIKLMLNMIINMSRNQIRDTIQNMKKKKNKIIIFWVTEMNDTQHIRRINLIDFIQQIQKIKIMNQAEMTYQKLNSTLKVSNQKSSKEIKQN